LFRANPTFLDKSLKLLYTVLNASNHPAVAAGAA
jgi:hypothetical protein